MNPSAINTTTQLATLDTSIAKGVNWLLADTTYNPSSNLDLAHRLIGFGVAKEYYAGTDKEESIQTKMDQAAEILRSRQRADGGWGKEITIEAPLIPTRFLDANRLPKRGLYIGPWAFGIEQNGECL